MKVKQHIKSYAAPRTQYDAVTLANIPTDANAVAAYKNGLYANEPQARDMFPDARITGISVAGDVIALVFDVEAGDYSISDVPRLYHKFKQAHPGLKPTFYTSASNVETLINTLSASGVSRKSYIIWSAHYTDKRHVCGPLRCGYPKANATQYTTSGETCDVTKCRPSYWRRRA